MALNLSGLHAFRAELADAVDAGVKQAAEYVGDLAQQLAPEDSGDLKASMQVTPGETLGRWIVSFGNEVVDYAGYVEYGTSDPNYPAQPYLTPAFEQIDVQTEIAKQIQALISRSRQ